MLGQQGTPNHVPMPRGLLTSPLVPQHNGVCPPGAGEEHACAQPEAEQAATGALQQQQQQPSWLTLPPKGVATSELCCFCFQVLHAHLQGHPPPAFPNTADPLFRAPLFVTWLKRRRGGLSAADMEIRGCIGCLEPIVLSPGLSEYALKSSLEDRRFPPVKLDEVPWLTCKLSILHRFEACSHVHDWQIGLHGVLIRFQDRGGRQYSATYLPEVAYEHGMTREVAIQELVAKAGYVGPCDDELLNCLEVTRYQTLVETVAYRQYLCCFGSSARDAGQTC
mmetsp:Transcript_62773/g.187150  ORF Transcript_62773/g.187150 Transcript_62773/m.187150 type:complete len:279 (+) Transcript_62773:137-973(+)